MTEDKTLHLNTKIPGYKKYYDKVVVRYIEDKKTLKHGVAEVIKWLIDKELGL